MRPGSSGHPCRTKKIQSSLIIMPVDTALWIEAGCCGAGIPPFQAQTRLNGVIRQWLMRTFGRRLERTRPPPRVIRRASEFRLVIKLAMKYARIRPKLPRSAAQLAAFERVRANQGVPCAA